ncbi:MAG: bifunctional precorrin-2 dehydrogenase/sirohydrochlorin ferrochelatase [Phycisphaerae bacterium]|nr:bifunctional precorrin-2 dehydrogenase/sirohydrochlorin ferrochelatase [Phycisphaerae bacterium]
MKTFPILLDLHGKLVVIVGAGDVGLRKAHALLDAGAEVKLVAESVPPEAQALRDVGVLVIQKPYCPEHLEGATLVFACTDDRALNAQIASDAQWVGALVNVADQPAECDFTMPAVANDGEVVIAVGTGGAAPALAGRLRDQLAAALPPRVGEFTAALAILRDELKPSLPRTEDRTARMRRLASRDAYEAFLQGGIEALRALQ